MVQRCARLLHPFATGLFVACGVIQVFLAGLGVFDDPRAFVTHREFGYLFGWLTLVMLMLALVGREPRRVTGLSALLLVQFALQSAFVAVRADIPAVAALHPLNGFTILLVGTLLTRMSWAVRRDASAPAPVRTATAHSFASPEAG